MKQSEIEANKLYWAKVNGKRAKVRVTDITLSYDGKKRYHILNLETGRKTLFRSAAKFQEVVT